MFALPDLDHTIVYSFLRHGHLLTLLKDILCAELLRLRQIRSCLSLCLSCQTCMFSPRLLFLLFLSISSVGDFSSTYTSNHAFFWAQSTFELLHSRICSSPRLIAKSTSPFLHRPPGILPSNSSRPCNHAVSDNSSCSVASRSNHYERTRRADWSRSTRESVGCLELRRQRRRDTSKDWSM